MQFDLDDSANILARTPRVLSALLRDLDERWTGADYGPKTFSPFDVVGHFVHGERADWMTRARIILEHGESQPFDPFDRSAQYQDSRGRTMGDLLDEFARLRGENLAALAALDLDDTQLALRGIHPDPAFEPVTLRNLLATWVVHDLHHTAQICKGLARQYAGEVGPWRAYVGILDPARDGAVG